MYFLVTEIVERLLEIPETQVSDGKERETVYELFASGAPLDSFPHVNLYCKQRVYYDLLRFQRGCMFC